MVNLLVTKHSNSTPLRQANKSPPLEPTGRTWTNEQKPRLCKILQASEGDVLVSERKITSGELFLTLILRLRIAEGRDKPLQFQARVFMAGSTARNLGRNFTHIEEDQVFLIMHRDQTCEENFRVCVNVLEGRTKRKGPHRENCKGGRQGQILNFPCLLKREKGGFGREVIER